MHLPQENLRKMQRADLGKILDVATGTGQSSVRLGAEVWQPAGTGKVILCAAFYTDSLQVRVRIRVRVRVRFGFGFGLGLGLGLANPNLTLT